MVQEGALTALASVADSSQVLQEIIWSLILLLANDCLTLRVYVGALPKIL